MIAYREALPMTEQEKRDEDSEKERRAIRAIKELSPESKRKIVEIIYKRVKNRDLSGLVLEAFRVFGD